MIRTSRLPRRERRHAVAAVEMAFLLPSILMPLLFGMWEIGRLIQVQQVVANAVREGGRTASAGKVPFTNAQVQQVVLNYLQNGGISTAGVTPTVVNLTRGGDVSQAQQLDQLQVTVSVPYSNVQWLAFNWILPAGMTMNASATWMSMANVPLVVSTTIPSAPQ